MDTPPQVMLKSDPIDKKKLINKNKKTSIGHVEIGNLVFSQNSQPYPRRA
ncbi:hypothetical protein C427_4411 [Paraglaciecola psychrophila 170]|uniref:Uncharacterized protein n=1 Tax=Paraglaciecola psychrophila 170 TaxID=1129794 RepID=K7AET3_9ALTE|nr:hypothetical protein C427_4411 [Paraglaciecola psychrophila 170]GAC39158.1 hypothetical protein GPSY_3547 [Paraglaciecola psychrophila 170]